MSSKRLTKMLAVAVALTVAFLAGLFAAGLLHAVWQLKHEPLVTVNARDVESFGKLLELANNLAARLRTGQIPGRQVDFSSVGSPDREAELVRLRYTVDLFQLKFGHLPKQTSDLLNLLGDENHLRYAGLYQHFGQDCTIGPVDSESFVLNCDGWEMPERADLLRLVNGFEPGKEKFYRVGSHIVLYAPPFIRFSAGSIKGDVKGK